MSNALRILCCALTCCAAGLTRTLAVEPPFAVPSIAGSPFAGTLAPLKQDLDRQRTALLERYQQWKEKADAFNRAYAGREFDEGSKEAQEGAAEQARVAELARAYTPLVRAFDVRVAKLAQLLSIGIECEKVRQAGEASRQGGGLKAQSPKPNGGQS